MKRTRTLELAVIAIMSVLLLPPALAADEGDVVRPESAPAVELRDTATDSVYSLINASYQNVRPIFERSCFDCHSSFTDFPWYHSLPLIGGMLDDHVKEGREHLDLTDDFPFGGEGAQEKLLGEIREEIEEGKMPLWSYRLMHWGTAIENERRDSVFYWLDESLELLRSHAAPSPRE